MSAMALLVRPVRPRVGFISPAGLVVCGSAILVSLRNALDLD
jgi:hypothetical protein